MNAEALTRTKRGRWNPPSSTMSPATIGTFIAIVVVVASTSSYSLLIRRDRQSPRIAGSVARTEHHPLAFGDIECDASRLAMDDIPIRSPGSRSVSGPTVPRSCCDVFKLQQVVLITISRWTRWALCSSRKILECIEEALACHTMKIVRFTSSAVVYRSWPRLSISSVGSHSERDRQKSVDRARSSLLLSPIVARVPLGRRKRDLDQPIDRSLETDTRDEHTRALRDSESTARTARTLVLDCRRVAYSRSAAARASERARRYYCGTHV